MLFLLVQPTWPVQIALVSYYTVSFLFGAVGQFFMPAQGASIPALVPRDQLTAANALFNLTFTATQLLGFAILGPLLSQALGVDMLFIVTMVAFVISALLTLWLPPMPIPHRVVNVERVSAVRRVWSDIREGLVYIKQDAILTKAIAYLTFATTIFMLIAALAPNFVATVVGLPPGDIGYLVAPAGIGVIVGVVIVPRLSSRFRRDALIDWAVVVGGLCAAAAFAQSRDLEPVARSRNGATDARGGAGGHSGGDPRHLQRARARAVADDLAGAVSRAHPSPGLRDVFHDHERRLVHPDLLCRGRGRPHSAS